MCSLGLSKFGLTDLRMGASERCQARVVPLHDLMVGEVLVFAGEFLRAVGVVAERPGAGDDNLGFGEELLDQAAPGGAAVVGQVGDVVRVAADPVRSRLAMRDDPILDVAQVLLLDGPEQKTRGVGDSPRVEGGTGCAPSARRTRRRRPGPVRAGDGTAGATPNPCRCPDAGARRSAPRTGRRPPLGPNQPDPPRRACNGRVNMASGLAARSAEPATRRPGAQCASAGSCPHGAPNNETPRPP